jgi:hypothetical protein
VIRFVVAVGMLAWAGAAAADLYRWVDPETGSIKFSSYPPPWFGDPARERRAPKVEVIPERSSAPAGGPRPDEEPRPEPRPKAPARPAEASPEKPAAIPGREARKEERADGR